MKAITLIHKRFKTSGEYRENNMPLIYTLLLESVFFFLLPKQYENLNFSNTMLKHYRKQKYEKS